MGCQLQHEKITLLGNISNISVSDFKNYGGLNEKFFLVISDQREITSFEEIIKSAVRKKGTNLVGKPTYDLLIQYDDGKTHGFHLLLGDKDEESKVLFIGHEEKVFVIKPELTNQLRKLIVQEIHD